MLQDLVAKGLVFCVVKVELYPDGGGWGAHEMYTLYLLTSLLGITSNLKEMFV